VLYCNGSGHTASTTQCKACLKVVIGCEQHLQIKLLEAIASGLVQLCATHALPHARTHAHARPIIAIIAEDGLV
jgi:hypothetical protein